MRNYEDAPRDRGLGDMKRIGKVNFAFAQRTRR